jgi:hypothetical protein
VKGLINGEIVELTDEQIKFFGLDKKVDSTPTDSQRIAALENALADIAVILAGGVDNE